MSSVVTKKKQEEKMRVMKELGKKGRSKSPAGKGPVASLLESGYKSPFPGESLAEGEEEVDEDELFEPGMESSTITGPGQKKKRKKNYGTTA